MDAGVIRLTYHKAVYDDRFGYNIRSRNLVEPGAFSRSGIPVSYTHLDVYKRQEAHGGFRQGEKARSG